MKHQYTENLDYTAMSYEQPVLMKFSAEWCAPCKNFGPIIDSVAEELALSVVEVDIDQHFDLARMYSVRSVPTTVLINGGEMQANHVGTMSATQLKDFLSRNLD